MRNPYYRAFSSYLRERFGEKVYRISLDAGFTCPNRDGTLGQNGCAYCSPTGSWNKTEETQTLIDQVRRGKEIVRRRYKAHKFIAYFQAYTNTYSSAGNLKKIYDSVVLGDSDFVGLAIGTRPDCIDKDKLELISSYREKGLEVWIEYGLQSANNSTLALINRGHCAEDFSKAVYKTKKYNILIGAHVILGLPCEKRNDMIRTAQFLAGLPVDGVKIHNLNIVKNTKVADMYYKGEIKPLSLQEFAQLAVDFLEYTNTDVIIERIVAESNPLSLIEPKWSLNKQAAISEVIEEFKRRNSYQGKLYL